jgi:adenylate cyclase
MSDADERWRWILLHGDQIRRRRQFRRAIPSAPRCKMCLAPFAGIGGLVMPWLGHGRWPKNPKYCAGCFRTLRENHGGAEVECSLLFADVRGSTALAERMSPRDFNRLMGRFYDKGFAILVDHDAFVDKFVGDEIIGVFVPAMAGEAHATRAVDAARGILAATGHGAARTPWVPVGVGVSTGLAYIGSIGEGPDTELTAMGDLVNTTARLSSVAAAGEILVTLPAAGRAGLAESLPHRSLELKGKRGPTEVAVLTIA